MDFISRFWIIKCNESVVLAHSPTDQKDYSIQLCVEYAQHEIYAKASEHPTSYTKMLEKMLKELILVILFLTIPLGITPILIDKVEYSKY